MSHIKDRLIQLRNEVENTGNGAYFSKNNISKIVELLLADLEQDEKENGWIPVGERVPEGKASTNYLVSIKGEGVDIANYVSITNEWYCFGLPCEVVAWMPLPELYHETEVKQP